MCQSNKLNAMIQDQFNFRGLRIGLTGIATALGGGGLRMIFGESCPTWLILVLGIVGIGLVVVGEVVHFRDMIEQRRAEAEARRAWIALHGDPDHRDDPAMREKATG
jgi:hypothetical protein